MRFFHLKPRIRIVALCITSILFLVSAFPVQAAKTVTDYESELSDLNKDLETIEKDLNYILAKIKNTSSDLESIRKELAIAKGKEEAQYESMKLRIKYMYENSNLSMLEMVLTSSCLAEFLSRSENFIKIKEYDREQLKKYTETCEQIEKQEAKLKEQQEYLHALQADLDAKEKTLKSKISKTSQDLSKYLAKLEKAREEAEKAESSANRPIKPIAPESGSASGNSGTTTTRPGVSATADDVELLAALIECEAGSTNYAGMLAVGAVVVNRMKSPYYPNTLRGVVFQSGQFPPALNGKVDRILQRGVRASCRQAAQDALNGKNNIGNCLSFRSASSGRQGIVVGDNVFF